MREERVGQFPACWIRLNSRFHCNPDFELFPVTQYILSHSELLWVQQSIPDICHLHHMRCRCQIFQPGVKISRINVFLMFFGIRNTDLAWFVVSNCWAENGAGVNKMTNITYATVEFNICIWSNVKQVFFCNYSSNKLSVQLNICPGLTFVLVLLLNRSIWTGYLLKW